MRKLIFALSIFFSLAVTLRIMNIPNSFSEYRKNLTWYVSFTNHVSTTEIKGEKIILVDKILFKKEGFQKIHLICGENPKERISSYPPGENHLIFPFPNCPDPSFLVTTKKGEEIKLGPLPSSFSYEFGITDVGQCIG